MYDGFRKSLCKNRVPATAFLLLLVVVVVMVVVVVCV